MLPFTHVQHLESVSPRFHLAYDVTGDGKTLIQGGWGMYVHQRGIDELQMGTRAGRQRGDVHLHTTTPTSCSTPAR
jgi:hypothetical protein